MDKEYVKQRIEQLYSYFKNTESKELMNNGMSYFNGLLMGCALFCEFREKDIESLLKEKQKEISDEYFNKLNQ